MIRAPASPPVRAPAAAVLCHRPWPRHAPSLLACLRALGASGAASAELGLHPGEHDDEDLARYRWGYRWGDELDALCAPEARRAVERAGFGLGSYAALAGAET